MPNPKLPCPAQFREQMVELVRAGKKPAELAKEFGCHVARRHTVGQIARQW